MINYKISSTLVREYYNREGFFKTSKSLDTLTELSDAREKIVCGMSDSELRLGRLAFVRIEQQTS